MNKGICFYFGYVYDDIQEHVKDIKNAGFDCVMDSSDPKFRKQTGTLKRKVKLLKKNGVKLSSLHSRYVKIELPHFWCDDKIGKKLEKDLIKDIKIASKYGFTCVVYHMKCNPNKEHGNEFGYARLKRILKKCEKLNIPLALENLSDNFTALKDIFDNIKSDYLKFCWDVGHNHAFTPDIDFASLYKDKLITVHLHDNLGAFVDDEHYKKIGYTNTYPQPFKKLYNPDMHTLNKYGSIDWNEVAKKLAAVDHPLNLDYEVMMVYRKKETSQQVLKTVYKQAKDLEKMIEEHKKQPKF